MIERRRWMGYAWAVAAVAAATVAGWAMHPRFDLVNIAMVYLLAVVIVALRFSRGPAVVASVLCVLAFDFLFVPPRGTLTVDDAQYLLTFAIMLAVALVISRLVDSVRDRAAAQAALEIEAETERIRSALLASISHDLRTPLAVMAGASSSLAESGERLSPAERKALAESVFGQAREMSEHVAKVLQMTRLETGAITLDCDWVALNEIVGSVLERLSGRMAGHRVIVDLPDDLPLLKVDATLIEQALGNLLDNRRPGTRRPRRSCACGRSAGRRKSSSPSRITAAGFPMPTSSACSRNSTAARSRPRKPGWVSASRSVARSCACMAAGPGPSGFPGRNGIPLHASGRGITCGAAGTRLGLTWPTSIRRSSSSRTSPRSGASCVPRSVSRAIASSNRRRGVAGPSMRGRTSPISRSSISRCRTSMASR